MLKKSAKRFLSVLLVAVIALSCFAMNISAAEENVASIGDVYYNSVEDALNAAVSGDTVIVQKDTTITQNVTVKAGVTLLVPHKDGYTGYDPSSGNPDVNSNATGYVTDVLYRTLTVNEGVTIEVNGTVMVTALIGLKKSGHYRHEVNGNYAQMVLNGKMNVNNGGVVVANGYIKGSGEIEAFSGAEVRDLFVIEHFRGGTHSSYMRTQGVWIANEYDVRNITVEITIHYGAEFTVQNVAYFNSSFSYNVVTFIGSSDGIFILKEGGKFVRTIEYRERIGKEAEVYKLYGGGYLGSISIKFYISVLPVTVNSSSFVVSMDGDNELHLYDGEYNTYYNSKAISMKFLPGCEVTIHDGAKFSVDRYKTTTRDRYSQIVAYRELTDSQFTVNYRYPQGRPSAKCFVENGGELYVDGEIGGEIYLDSGAVVTKGDNAVFSVTTKESAKLSTRDTETYVNDAEFIAPEGYHTRWEGNQLVIEEHTYSAEVTADKAPTCTASGTGKYLCTLEGCGAYTSTTIPATGHNYKAVVTAPTCTEKGFTTHTCANCGDSYVNSYVNATGHTYGDWVVTDATCTADGSKTKTCAVCSATVTEKISATGHTAGRTETVNATCTKDGKTTVYCSVCGGIISETVIESAGHDYKKAVTAPDCENKGFTTYTCSVCGDSYIADYVNALGHTEETTVVDADCENAGLKTTVCTVCNKVLSEETIPALGHTEETITVDATCEENGSIKTVCTVCNKVLSEETIPALGHTEETTTVDADCENAGSIKTVCTVCDKVLSEETIPALGHTEETTTVDADCENAGSIKTVCTVCDKVLSEETISALGHTEETTKVDADCENAGSIKTVCTVCDKVLSEETIPALGHSWSQWTEVNGKQERVCSGCGLTEQREIPTAVTLLKTIRGTASFKTFKGEKCIAITIEEGKTATGVYTELTDGGSVEITDVYGNIQSLADRYVAYQAQNMSNPVATMTLTYADGKVETYPVVFELYDMESEISFNPAEKIKPIRGKVSLATDEKGDYVLVEMNEGQSSVGIYKASLDGSTVTFIDADGKFIEQEKLHIFYGSQNTFNPEGRISVTEADGTTKVYRIVYKLYETDPYVNAAKGLRPIRGAVIMDADGTIRIKMTSGQTSVGLYKTTANGTTFEIADANGKLTNNPSSLMFYKTNNVANITATIIFTMPDGTTKEQKIIFDMGLADNPDPLVYLETLRGTLSYQNDGTEEYIELKANALSTGVGIYKDSLVKFTITDIDGVVSENDSRYYFYKSQNPDGATAKINILQSDGTYKAYTLKIVF